MFSENYILSLASNCFSFQICVRLHVP